MLTIQNIHLQVNRSALFTDFSLKLASGEKLLLTGPSGSGKSTLFKMILGFRRPDQGKIFIADELLTESTLSHCRKKCAYVSQQPDLGDGIVRDLIETILHYAANRHLKKTLHDYVSVARRFNLTEAVMQEPFETLSGGEKQRIMLSLAVLLERQLYLLDEPTAALDPELKDRVARYFMRECPHSVVVVSHDTVWQQFAAPLHIPDVGKSKWG